MDQLISQNLFFFSFKKQQKKIMQKGYALDGCCEGNRVLTFLLFFVLYQ